MIKIKNLNKTYTSRKITHHALKDINLDFGNSGLNFILGKSGCGKTTLMNLIGGLDTFDSGDIIIKHLSLAKASNTAKDRLRNTVVGFIFQDFNLIEHMTVLENVSISLQLQGNHTTEKGMKLAKKALSDVGLENLGNRKINELSGGQKQRVAIARALIKNPDILLCDEPTGNLDDDTSNNIFDLLKEISKKKLVIVVSHNDKLAYHYGDRVINILDGQIIKDELTNKVKDTTTKTLEYKNDVDLKAAAREVVKSIDNNSIIKASLENSCSESSNNKVIKQKKYEVKDISMFRVLFKTAFGYFTLRKVRLVLLTMLMSFSLAIGAYMIGMYTYDGTSDTLLYLEKYDFGIHRLHCSSRNWYSECDDSLYTDYLLDSELGEEAIAYSGNGALDSKLNITIPHLTNTDSPHRQNKTEIPKILVDSRVDLGKYFDLAPGSTSITGINDIYITDRIGYLLDSSKEPGDFINTTLESTSGEDTFTIKGVILTDYEEINFDTLSYVEGDQYAYKYNLILYNKDYVTDPSKNQEVINGVNVPIGENSYINLSRDGFGKVSNHIGIDADLLVGDIPKSNNEIVVSKEYICDVMLFKYSDTSCTDSSISESELNDKFENYIGRTITGANVSWGISSDAFEETFGDQLVIVGIMDDITTVDENVGFLVTDEVIDTYYVNLVSAGSKYVFLEENDYEYFTNYLYDATNSDDVIGKDYILKFDAFDTETFMMFSDLSNITTFIVFVVIITFIFTLVATVISNFNLNFIVENKKKEIGIFKSQGYTNRQLYTIFIIVIALQTIIITVISATLTNIVMNLFKSITVDKELLYSGYEFITFGIEEFLFLFTCTFVFGVLSLYKPLKKMAKTEPIDVIKNL